MSQTGAIALSIDWNWLGLETPEKERTADSLVVAMEWMCFKISEKGMIDCLLDSPWPCAVAVLRTLQMCEPNDMSVLQMPRTCPWCGATIKLEGNSLYVQIWNYASHMMTAKACVCTYTGIMAGSELKDQAFPNVWDLLSVKDKQEVTEFQSDCAVVYISGKGNNLTREQKQHERERGRGVTSIERWCASLAG